MDTFVLLAVTKMLSGFCLAGIDEEGRWARPVKRFGSLQLGDVSYRDRTLMRPFDRTRLFVERRRPDPPHVEDCICEFVRRRPELVDHLSPAERAGFLARRAEPEIASLVAAKRSLALTRVDDLAATFRLDGYSGKYEARLRLPGVDGERGLPVTDLRWRALGRALLKDRAGSVTLTLADLRERSGVTDAYVALGLARQFDGRHWPLVIGVHLVPDYEVTVDPRNP